MRANSQTKLLVDAHIPFQLGEQEGEVITKQRNLRGAVPYQSFANQCTEQGGGKGKETPWRTGAQSLRLPAKELKLISLPVSSTLKFM